MTTSDNLQWTFAGYVLRVTWLVCRNCGQRHQRQGFYKLLLSEQSGRVVRRYIPHSDRVSATADISRIVDNDHLPVCNSCFDTVVDNSRPTLDEANWRMTVERKYNSIRAAAAERKEVESGKINLLDFRDRVRASLDHSDKKELTK